MKLFADDTLPYIIADTVEEATTKLNSDLEVLYKKICQHKLKLNVITNKSVEKKDIHIFINNCKLTIVSEIKYLGVIIDENLTFVRHVDYICKKIGSIVSVLGRLRNDLSEHQKFNLYKSLVQPHFTYCASVLFLCGTNEIERLQKLQLTKIPPTLNYKKDLIC